MPNVTQTFCDKVALATNRLCDHSALISDETETIGIITAFLNAAEPTTGHTTYGNSQQRYTAAKALRRTWTDGGEHKQRGGPAHYLLDEHSDEYVIGVGDLHHTARRVTGTSHPHGWLDGRIDDIGGTRVTLQGWARPGRDGRKDPNGHARIDVYRVTLPADPDPPAEQDPPAESPVNT